MHSHSNSPHSLNEFRITSEIWACPAKESCFSANGTRAVSVFKSSTLQELKALRKSKKVRSVSGQHHDTPNCRPPVSEMLQGHWQHGVRIKVYLFWGGGGVPGRVGLADAPSPGNSDTAIRLVHKQNTDSPSSPKTKSLDRKASDASETLQMPRSGSGHGSHHEIGPLFLLKTA